jgi:hypothetical protein
MKKVLKYPRYLRSAQGYTLTEVAITMLMTSLVALGMMSATGYLHQQSGQVRNLKTSDEMIVSLLRSIADNVNQYQINYEIADAKNAFSDLTPSSLTMAWSSSIIVPQDQCQSCPGRFGYSIRPLAGYGGLYLVSVRLTHKELFSGKPMDYQFLVSGK